MVAPTLSIVAVAMAGAAPASVLPPSFVDAEVVETRRVSTAPPAAPGDAFWRSVPGRQVQAHPQRAVRLNDRRANDALARAAPVPLTVKAAHDAKTLALWMEWPDESKSLASRSETAAFGDAVAVQLPVTFGEGHRLPHIAMGDQREWVYLYLARAAEGAGVVPGEFVAAGFSSRTRRRTSDGNLSLEYDAAARRWRATLLRPLVSGDHSLAAGLVPVAFAVWEGGRSERGGNKALTSWKFLRLSGHPLNEKYAAELTWGYRPGELGDAAAGKVLVEAVCTSCHRVGDKQLAPVGLAPDLTGIGGIHSAAYLRESIVAPSHVVVHAGNPNAHYDRKAKPDPFGAYPNNPAYAWDAVDGRGQRVSKMPPFAQLRPADLANMVAYLKSLEGGSR